jgi:mannose-1-phosphate guanylyltransferase
MGTPDEMRVIGEIYPEIPKISIDYGIMERSKDVLMLAGDFGWNDIGSLDMLGIMKKEDENGNVTYGEQINLDTKNCILYGKDKLIATIGVENLIVLQEKDAILICDKSRAQEVKNIVDRLAAEGKEKYL